MLGTPDISKTNNTAHLSFGVATSKTGSKNANIGKFSTFWRSSMWYCGCSMAGPIRPSRSATAHASEICCAVHSDVPLEQQQQQERQFRHWTQVKQLSQDC